MNTLIMSNSLNNTIHRGFYNAFKSVDNNTYLISCCGYPKLIIADILKKKAINVILCTINSTVSSLPTNLINEMGIRVVCHAQAIHNSVNKTFDPGFTETASQYDVDILKSINNVILWSQHEPDINRICFDQYEKIDGLKTIYLPHCADITRYKPLSLEQDIKLSFIGGIAHKMTAAYKFLHPLVKIYGNAFVVYGDSAWQNLGVKTTTLYDTNAINNITCRSLICPNIQSDSVRLSKAIVNERTFTIAACGGFQITDMKETKKFFDCEVASTPYEFISKVDYYIHHPEKRLPYIQGALNSVINFHTYYHRISTILETLKMKEEQEKFDCFVEKYIKENFNEI